MHDLNTSNCTSCTPEGFKAEHRVRDAFHCSMILFYEVVQIFGVANDDSCLAGPVVVRDSGSVASTLVDRDFLGRVPAACG
jgi:hypothetical protein